MSYRQRLIKLAAKLECRLEFGPMWDITAPDNHCFACDPGCHYIVFEPWRGDKLEERYQDAFERLSCGLQECHCGDCDPD
jgi:hypothetical protein